MIPEPHPYDPDDPDGFDEFDETTEELAYRLPDRIYPGECDGYGDPTPY